MVASEVGTIDIPDEDVVEKGRLAPGEMIAVDTRRNLLLHNDKIKDEVKVAPEEMREYYEKNKANFRILEKRALKLVLLDPAKISESINVTDEQIRRAREDGAFDNLPGAGKPLPDLEGGYDPDWWVKKLVQREKVSVLPPALELLRKVESEMKKIWALRSEADVRAQVLGLNVEIARANARTAEGPPTRLGLLDPDAIVAQWRARPTSSRT